MDRIPVSLSISGSNSICGDIVLCALAFPYDIYFDYELSQYVKFGTRINENAIPDILNHLAEVEPYVMFEHISPEMLNDADTDELAVYRASELLISKFLATYELDPPEIMLFRKESQGSLYFNTELVSLKKKNGVGPQVFYERAHYTFGSILAKSRRLKKLALVANQFPEYKIVDHKGNGWIAREEVLRYGPNLRLHHIRDVWAIQKNWYMNLGMHRLTRRQPRILVGRWDLQQPKWWSKYFDSPFGSALDSVQIRRVADGLELITGNREELPPRMSLIQIGQMIEKEDLEKISDDYKLPQLEKDKRLARLKYLKRRSLNKSRQTRELVRRQLMEMGIDPRFKGMRDLLGAPNTSKILQIKEEIIQRARERGSIE